MASRNGLPWSAEEVKRLRDMAAEGMSASQIAAAIERTTLGIKSKALALGITLARDIPSHAKADAAAATR